MARTGRPSTLTDDVRDAICADIKITGCPAEVAAKAHGVKRSTFYDWCARGRKEEKEDSDEPSPHRDFLDAVVRAKACWQLEALRKIESIEDFVADPRTASAISRSIQWKLERLDRETYGAAVTVKVEETKAFLLDVLERVCERMGREDVLEAVFDELARSGPGEEIGSPGEGEEG